MHELKKMLRTLGEECTPNPLAIICKSDEELTQEDSEVVSELIKANKYNRGSLIISGGGGHFDTAIDLAIHLKHKFNNSLISYIPKQASSALAYPILLSNHAYCCTNTPLSQFDLTFDKNGKTYKAREELNNPDIEIRDTARFLWNTSSEIIKNMLSRHDSLFSIKKVQDKHVIATMDICMRNGPHEKSIRLNDLIKLGFNISNPNPQLATKLNEFYNRAIEVLNNADGRFVLGNQETLLIKN